MAVGSDLARFGGLFCVDAMVLLVRETVRRPSDAKKREELAQSDTFTNLLRQKLEERKREEKNTGNSDDKATLEEEPPKQLAGERRENLVLDHGRLPNPLCSSVIVLTSHETPLLTRSHAHPEGLFKCVQAQPKEKWMTEFTEDCWRSAV